MATTSSDPRSNDPSGQGDPGPRRACLAVPGHKLELHAKARATTADEIVLDLEDAVAPGAKDEARATVLASLGDPGWEGRRVAVRVNGTDTPWFADDVAAVATATTGARLTIVLPKAQSAGDVRRACDALDRAGAPADLGIQALLETPTGVACAREIAGADARLRSLILGYVDLGTELGRRAAQDDPSAWIVAQDALLAAAREHGLEAIDGPWVRLGDAAGLAASCTHTRALGFDGKWAIHPEQVPVIVRAFSATTAEVAHARATVEALDAASTGGDAAVRVAGAMVDEAHRPGALRILASAAPGPDDGTVGDGDPAATVLPAGPVYEDMAVGDTWTAPGVTLDAGMATLHRAICGDRLALALDAPMARELAGLDAPLAHPMVVCDVAIGQSTAPSARVLGNLFYRGLAARPVTLGTTLRTTTTVVAKRRAKTPRGGGAARGLVVLRVTTTDEDGAPVLDFHRCPLIPARDDRPDEAGDDIGAIPADLPAARLDEVTPREWDLAPLRALGGPHANDLAVGTVTTLEARETVTAATELARATLNVALTHTDAAAGTAGRRLVYGGHVIGIAAAHVTRVIPSLATILAWRSCDHLGPTFEGDRLTTSVEVQDVEPLGGPGTRPPGPTSAARVGLRVRCAVDDPVAGPRPVLDWRLVALVP